MSAGATKEDTGIIYRHEKADPAPCRLGGRFTRDRVLTREEWPYQRASNGLGRVWAGFLRAGPAGCIIGAAPLVAACAAGVAISWTGSIAARRTFEAPLTHPEFKSIAATTGCAVNAATGWAIKAAPADSRTGRTAARWSRPTTVDKLRQLGELAPVKHVVAVGVEPTEQCAEVALARAAHGSNRPTCKVGATASIGAPPPICAAGTIRITRPVDITRPVGAARAVRIAGTIRITAPVCITRPIRVATRIALTLVAIACFAAAFAVCIAAAFSVAIIISA
ncbi:MAG TPA: hypothetical protein VJ828_14475 [Lacipirellulaceae bacterium]|nr:hypothetical protein [Lacipirellulaceae bacterium]